MGLHNSMAPGVTGLGVKLPLNPAVEFARPRAQILLDVQPNPAEPGPVQQTWTTSDLAFVGFDIKTLRENFYNADSTLQSTLLFAKEEIAAAFDSSRYIPPRDTIVGTLNAVIPAISGGWITIIMSIEDENDNFLTDSLVIPVL